MLAMEKARTTKKYAYPRGVDGKKYSNCGMKSIK